MTLNEYQQKTHETAVYPQECAKEYLLLGLAGEVGEICNKYKKTIRDNKPIDDDDMISELGDVMWYVSELCNLYKLNFDKIMERATWRNLINVNLNITKLIFNLVTYISKILNKDSKVVIKHTFEYFSVDILYIMKKFDIQLHEVLSKNIAKLQDRKNRGVIKGSGDNR